MTITNISSLEELNKICYDDFVNENSLTKFNHFTAYIINKSIIPQFKTALSQGQSLGQFVVNLSDQTGVATHEMTTSAESIATYELYTSGFTGEAYFIPLSRKDFIASYFSDVAPQLSDSIFDLMKSTGRLIQIGSGGGKAFVLKPTQFTEVHLQSLPVSKTTEELLDAAQDIVDLLKLQLKDNNYYVQKLAEKDEIISNLQNHISELNNKINQVYQTTWR
jgi:hypothetical protein